MSVEIIRSSDYPSGIRCQGPIYWFRVLSYTPGASIQLAGGVTLPLLGLEALPCRQNGRGEKVPWDFLEFPTGSSACVLEVAKDSEMPFPGALANQAPLLGAQNDTVVSLATGTVAAVSGTLTALNDAVSIAATGNQYATVKFTVIGTGTATATAEVSLDGGINWVAAPYAKRTDATSANPTVQAISASTLVSGQTWEVPLPGSCTNFRLRCASAGTTTTVTVSGGTLYVPGVPVVAVLYDQTAVGGVSLGTGTLDFAGWNAVALMGANNDTGGTNRVLVLQSISDGGAVFATVGATLTLAQANASALSFARAANGSNAYYLPKRGQCALTAGTGTGGTSEMRVEAYR